MPLLRLHAPLHVSADVSKPSCPWSPCRARKERPRHDDHRADDSSSGGTSNITRRAPSRLLGGGGSGGMATARTAGGEVRGLAGRKMSCDSLDGERSQRFVCQRPHSFLLPLTHPVTYWVTALDQMAEVLQCFSARRFILYFVEGVYYYFIYIYPDMSVMRAAVCLFGLSSWTRALSVPPRRVSPSGGRRPPPAGRRPLRPNARGAPAAAGYFQRAPESWDDEYWEVKDLVYDLKYYHHLN